MCSESNSKLYRLVQQCISTTELGKFKRETLNELLATLMSSGIKDRKTNILLRSMLSASRGNKIGYSTLNEVYKYLKNSRKPKTDGFNPLREIYDNPNQNGVPQNVIQPNEVLSTIKNFEYTYQLRSSKQFSRINSPISTSSDTIFQKPKYIKSEQKAIAKSSELVPVPIINNQSSIDGLKSEERTPKIGFLEYLKLQPSDSQYTSKPTDINHSFSMSMFNNSASVPFSSELGRLLAERVNHSVSDDFKLRKLQRLERYINKPYIAKDEDISYPVTYVEKKINNASNKKKTRTKNLVCKSFSVVIENVDLIELQKKINRLARRRRMARLLKLRKKCKQLKVVLTPSDRKNIERMIRMKNRATT